MSDDGLDFEEVCEVCGQIELLPQGATVAGPPVCWDCADSDPVMSRLVRLWWYATGPEAQRERLAELLAERDRRDKERAA